MCPSHGGAAPQVKLAAQDRILALVDPAIAKIAKLIRNGRPDGVALNAARDILDRAGLSGVSRFEIADPDGLRQLSDAELAALFIATGKQREAL